MKCFLDRLLVIILAFILVIFGMWIYVAPMERVSEKENRVLADLPKFNFESFTSGRFATGLGDFYRDRFPGRERFISNKCDAELLWGRKENNSVIPCDNGYLLIRPEYSSLDTYFANLSEIERFCERYEESNVSVFFAPRGIDVMTYALPSLYPSERERFVWEIADESDIDIINANAEISSAACDGEYVWFRTDHHWTSRGAYLAYKRVCERFEIDAIDQALLGSEWLESDFFGTVASRFGGNAPSCDRVELLRYRGDTEYAVVDYDTGKVSDSLYIYEYAAKKDKYAVFLGGNHGHIGIYKEGEGRETLLVIKDSFANSVIPYLAETYNLEVYDLRYFKGNIDKEVSEISPDKILLLYGIDSVVTDASIKYLNK